MKSAYDFTEGVRLQRLFQPIVWSNSEELKTSLAVRAAQDHKAYIESKKQIIEKIVDGKKYCLRKVRIVNIDLWDSCLTFESTAFDGKYSSVNPRNFLQLSADVNYDLDSEDELEERLGENADSEDADDVNSEDPRNDDRDLIEEGWLVPDDYISDNDSADSDVPFLEGENEGEHELRIQQKRIMREQKKQRFAFQKRLEERMKAVFRLGN